MPAPKAWEVFKATATSKSLSARLLFSAEFAAFLLVVIIVVGAVAVAVIQEDASSALMTPSDRIQVIKKTSTVITIRKRLDMKVC